MVVKARPGLPGFYVGGLVVNFFYMFVVIFSGYFIFKRHMYPKAEKPGKYNEVNIKAGYGNVEFVPCEQEDISNRVVNVFRGYNRGFNGKITVDQIDVVNTRITGFAIILNQAKIPGNIRVNQLKNSMKARCFVG